MKIYVRFFYLLLALCLIFSCQSKESSNLRTFEQLKEHIIKAGFELKYASLFEMMSGFAKNEAQKAQLEKGMKAKLDEMDVDNSYIMATIDTQKAMGSITVFKKVLPKEEIDKKMAKMNVSRGSGVEYFINGRFVLGTAVENNKQNTSQELIDAFKSF